MDIDPDLDDKDPLETSVFCSMAPLSCHSARALVACSTTEDLRVQNEERKQEIKQLKKQVADLQQEVEEAADRHQAVLQQLNEQVAGLQREVEIIKREAAERDNWSVISWQNFNTFWSNTIMTQISFVLSVNSWQNANTFEVTQ